MSEFLQGLKEKLGDSVENFEEIEQSYNDDVNGLKNKNIELINGQKRIKGELDSFKSKYSAIDLDKYAEMTEQFDEMKLRQETEKENKAKENNDLDFFKKQAEVKFNKANESWAKEKEDLLSERDSYANKFHSKIIELDLTNELKNVNVGDKYLPFVKSKFQSQAFVGLNDEGVEQIMMKDASGAEVPLKDFITSWSLEDEAKAVIVEPTTSGTGSKGSRSGNVSRKQQLQEQIEEAMKNRDSMRAMTLQAELERM